MVLNHIQPKIKKVLWKKQNGLLRNCPTTSQILTIRWMIEGVQTNYLRVTLMFVYFSKAFNSMHRRKKKLIILQHSFSKETFTALQKHENNGSLLWMRHRLLRHSHRSLARRYISTIFIYTPLRLRTSNIHWSNKRKWFHIYKGKKQMISHRNYYRCRHRRRPSSFRKFISSSRIPTERPRASSQGNWPQPKCK